jgi:hypothetical protein
MIRQYNNVIADSSRGESTIKPVKIHIVVRNNLIYFEAM